MKTLLIENAHIISFGDNAFLKENQSVYIENGIIKDVFDYKSKNYPTDEVIDANGKYLMPGFVNAHTHAYSALVRGFGKAAEALDFQQQLENLWWKLDKSLSLDDCYYSTMVLALDSIKHGTTTVIDHHASPFAVTGSLNRVADAFNQTGLRSCLCYELSDRDGQLISDEGIRENIYMLNHCQNNPSPMLKAMFGLHASFTVEDKTFEKVMNELGDLRPGYHIHTAEAQSDQLTTWKMSGKRVVKRLYDLGILGERSIAAHCVHIDEDEISLLKETNTMVVHNPQSNLNNAVGIADVVKLMNHKILTGLGTDAMTTNMLEEARVALFAQHLKQNHPTCAFMEIVNLLFVNNYKIAERIFGIQSGKIEAGTVADIILYDYLPPTPLDNTTIWGHLLYGFSQTPVDTTIVNGKVLMKNKILTLDLDEKEVLAKSREFAQKMWNRFK
jgi:putative selenium metabolism protein SsnA